MSEFPGWIHGRPRWEAGRPLSKSVRALKITSAPNKSRRSETDKKGLQERIESLTRPWLHTCVRFYISFRVYDASGKCEYFAIILATMMLKIETQVRQIETTSPSDFSLTLAISTARKAAPDRWALTGPRDLAALWGASVPPC